MNDNKSEITDLLKEMFEAEKEHGCGYYNAYSWLIPYCKLRKIVGMGDYYDDDMIKRADAKKVMSHPQSNTKPTHKKGYWLNENNT